jgi:leader peptidase (prepilin peptidase)/N-methyltransferase
MTAALLDASLVLMLGVVTVSDLRTRVVPDRPLAGGLIVALGLCALTDPAGLPERLAAGAGAAGFLLAAALIRPEGMGLGDVKLAGVLGVYLGAAVIVAMVVAFAAGSFAGVALDRAPRLGGAQSHDPVRALPRPRGGGRDRDPIMRRNPGTVAGKSVHLGSPA